MSVPGSGASFRKLGLASVANMSSWATASGNIPRDINNNPAKIRTHHIAIATSFVHAGSR
jgi:hypothetical protein